MFRRRQALPLLLVLLAGWGCNGADDTTGPPAPLDLSGTWAIRWSGLTTLDVTCGLSGTTMVLVQTDGVDEQKALDGLAALFRNKFGEKE